MAFKLPKYSDLTDQQRQVVNLPLDRNNLVTGAPGTGKSVIAIYRASDMAQAGKKVLMLVYNKPLMLYISSAIESLDIEADVNTWQSWISEFYKNEMGTNYPRINGMAYTYDWPIIKNAFSKLGKRYDQIIIDEAQDVPLELIESLLLISKSVTCFMDEHQGIKEMFTDPCAVAEVLKVRTAYKLYDNFRNTKGIFDFAKIFNPKDVADPVKTDPTKPSIIKCSNFGHADPTQLTSKMVQVLKRNYGLKYIGVFTNKQNQYITYSELKECLDDIDVYMYDNRGHGGQFRNIDFDDEGVFVLTYNTMKGLEFDAVLIPTCENINSNNDEQINNNLLYVAMTRASEKLYCFYIRDHSSAKFIDFFDKIKDHKDLLNWE